MTEIEIVTQKLRAGCGWQTIGSMFGISADRAKTKWQMLYEPPISEADLRLEREALLTACAEHMAMITDARARLTEIDSILVARRVA